MSSSNEHVPEANRTSTDDAARWFLRLQDPNATSQTFREWNQWLSVSPEHRRVYEEIEKTVLRMSRVAVVPPLPSTEEMERDPYDGSQPITQWNARLIQRRYVRYAMAAGLVSVLLAGGWLWMQHAQLATSGNYSYQTAAGERQVVELPEGSRVTLDADSALDVQLTTDSRSLILKRGEAYFQVAQDRQRPFVVHAGAAQVTAIGTAFNVRLSNDRTVVAVTEGKVEFLAEPITAPTVLSRMGTASKVQPAATRPRLTAQVAAGEAVSYRDDGNLHALPVHEAPLATTWLDGHRQYRNEPLRYVLADLDRYTGQRIEIADPRVGELEFTGTLNLHNSQAWLRGLSVALPVVITEQEDGTLSVGRQ